MISRFRILATVCAIAAAGTAGAATLPTGKFEMKWYTDGVTVSGAERPLGFRHWIPLMKVSKLTDWKIKLPKMVSQKPVAGASGGLVLVMDESRGTGTGYDTLYIKQAQNPRDVDMSDARKIALSKNESGRMTTDDGKPIYMSIKIGEAVRKALIELELSKNPDRKMMGEAEFVAEFALYGGWYAEVGSGDKAVYLHASDTTGNGIFNDKMTGESAGDELSAWRTGPQEYRSVMLGKAVLMDGALYAVTVSPSGDSVEIKPYPGESGTLTVEPVDGDGKPIGGSLFLNLLNDESDLRGDFQSGKLVLPAGKYSDGMWVVFPLGAGAESGQIGLQVSRSFTVSGPTRLTVGGPVSITVRPKDKALKPGQKATIEFDVKAGQEKLGGIQGFSSAMQSAEVTIKDPSGKVVHTGKTEVPWGWWSAPEYTFTPQKNWKAGTYQITVTYDASPYARPASGSAKLELVK